MVPCIKYAWPIEIFKIGPPYGLLCAHGLMFSSQEVLCSFYSLRKHNSIPKSKLHCFLKLILRGIFFHGICLNPKLPERKKGALLKRRVHGALLLLTETIKKCITAFLLINFLLQERRKPFPQGRSFLLASAKQKPVRQRLCSSLGVTTLLSSFLY